MSMQAGPLVSGADVRRLDGADEMLDDTGRRHRVAPARGGMAGVGGSTQFMTPTLGLPTSASSGGGMASQAPLAALGAMPMPASLGAMTTTPRMGAGRVAPDDDASAARLRLALMQALGAM